MGLMSDRNKLVRLLNSIDKDDIIDVRQRENIMEDTYTFEIEITKSGLAKNLSPSQILAKILKEQKERGVIE